MLKRCFILLLCVLLTACGREAAVRAVRELPKENNMSKESDGGMNTEVDSGNTAYFAGGCFWGMEKFMAAVPGVTDVVSGYANGNWDKDSPPSYEEVCRGDTGFREAVKVTFDPEKLDYEMLVRAYYLAIDPTVKNRQGNDVGTQYQTGIYYLGDAQKDAAEKVSDLVRSAVPRFNVEVLPFDGFYDAEEYHQDYLVKHPMGYCHISDSEIEEMKEMFRELEESAGAADATKGEKSLNEGGPVYEKPDDETLRKKLTRLQYDVTQNAATEAPFKNEYWDHFEKGIYVDIVSGEPLFSSEDKYKSSCGWPAFTAHKSDNMEYVVDRSFGMVRTEVRSGAADSHLGHVFENDPESPNGIRYCINSASLEFIPYEELAERGYEHTLDWFEK